MALHLDPRVPSVWRSPTELQFGVDRALARLSAVSNADERMVAALVAGVSRGGLSLIGAEAHATEVEVERLLRDLGPVLRPPEPAAEPAPRVVIDGDGPVATSVTRLLEGEGVRVGRRHESHGATSADLAVIVADYAIAPQRYGAWLRRDVPHLAVVAGDATVRIGPLVEPGAGPCLYCLDLARTDEDAAWPAIAAQLLGRLSPLDSPLLLAQVAAAVARLTIGRLRTGASELTSESMVVDAADGSVSVREHRPHAECACRALPGNVTALAPRRAAETSATSSAAARGGRG